MKGYLRGGFEPRFIVRRADGLPIDAARKYIVLDYGGSDPHAIEALKIYAARVRNENPNFADDLERFLEHPDQGPSQHE